MHTHSYTTHTHKQYKKGKTNEVNWAQEFIFPIQPGGSPPVLVTFNVIKRLPFSNDKKNPLVGTTTVDLMQRFEFLNGDPEANLYEEGMYVCVYVCMCVCVFVRMYAFVHT
jgi:hypothetical protein